ncbi:MAG: glycosyltransferase family 2 protein [Clostridia bacterium]|nr:glycosyltransferase family 2 protein [Clostridia bacterium]
MNKKVSIITPSYNSEKYIKQTIDSVRAQTYTDFEMLIVDDCSTDRTCEIVEAIAKEDSRVKLIRQEQNGGAALARNRALENSTGRFIAYLDADDIWMPEKLARQVEFMCENKCGFSCTSYEVIDDNGNKLNKFVHMLEKVNYTGFLTNNLLQTVGIMVDTSIVDKKYLVMPNMRRRQDAATWLQVLKSGVECYGLDEILAQYRRAENSLSSNKFKAVKGVWYLYREVEHLSLPFSCYCFVRYALLAVWKRIYIKK